MSSFWHGVVLFIEQSIDIFYQNTKDNEHILPLSMLSHHTNTAIFLQASRATRYIVWLLGFITITYE